jgi:predicted ATPase/DNA-binding CsgD family transcriptional regulator
MKPMSGPRLLPQAGISAREAEVLAAIGEHLSNAEIGARLFISVRTVESHVSSLLRKLGATDRRELADLAGGISEAEDERAVLSLPSPLTSFVGRAQERAALAQALQAHREVTAVGPGGVGKTRLALMVITDLADRFADGVWFVDLVPVSEPDLVSSAVAGALGIGEHKGRSIEAAVSAAIADGETLLALDNCEHVLDGVAPLVERLLSACPRLSVLATSRARLMVPFEWVYPVPPLSLPVDGGHSDAVALFIERSRAAGWPLDPADGDRVAEVCRALDGVALAIELAVARLPVLGLDGLRAGLSDQLRLLAGGHRADDRHRSVRAMLDWSHALLDDAEQTLLRRVAVFAAAFTLDAAIDVAGFPPVDANEVPDGLAHLAEQSLLTAAPSGTSTRYRALETIRQYGLDQLAEAGDLEETRVRHLRWCLAIASTLEQDDIADRPSWRARFEAVDDDLRSALAWAADRPDHQGTAHELALALARVTFARGFLAESQQRYEQAAKLTDDPAAVADGLSSAADAAMCRFFGLDAFRLRRVAARAALQADDQARAARYLAESATMINRAPGMLSPVPPPEDVDELIAAARDLAGDDSAAQAAIRVAEVFRAEAGGSELGTVPVAEDAIRLARQAGDLLTESAALDALTSVQTGLGMVMDAARSAHRRLEVLAPLSLDATVANEMLDALHMATETSIGAGDLRAARQSAERVRDLHVISEEGHLATARLIVTDAMAGNVNAVRIGAVRFREGWERAGRPRASNLGMAAAAVAMAYGFAGDDDARADWLAVIDALGVSPERLAGYGATFDAIVFLHRDQNTEAYDRMAAEPTDLRRWITGLWRQWYAALKAEAAVLARRPDAGERLGRARAIAAGNPIATAIVDRAEALLNDNRDALLATAAAFETAGCPYQQARSLVLAGGDDQVDGIARLTELGVAVPSLESPG